MNDIPQPYAALWVEGFRTFRRHMQGWLPLAIYFFIPLTAVCFYSFTKSAPYNNAMVDHMIDVFKHAQDAAYIKAHASATIPAERPDWQTQTSPVLIMLISLVQVYFYYCYFMRRENVVGDFRQNVGGFFYFIWKSILTFLLILVITIPVDLALALCVGIFALVAHFAHVSIGVMIAIIAPVILIVLVCVMVYLSTRYSLAFALAAARARTPIDASSALTRGNILRIFGNSIVMFIIFLPLLIIILAVSLGFGKLTDGNMTAGVILAAFYAAASIIFAGIFSAYRIVICRILYREKQAVDSSFAIDIYRG